MQIESQNSYEGEKRNMEDNILNAVTVMNI